METTRPVRKLEIIIVGIIFIIFAVALFIEDQYILSTSLILGLLALLKLDSLGKLRLVNFVEMEFYKKQLTRLLEVPENQIQIVKIPIGFNGEVIVGVSMDGRLITRFIAHIKIAFEEACSIELLIRDRALNNSIEVPRGVTGIFEDTVNTSSLSSTSDIIWLKVKVKIGKNTRIFGPANALILLNRFIPIRPPGW